MSKAGIYEEKTEALIMPILDEMNFELVDVEYVKEGSTYYLRAYIDKEGGITVNGCEAVARRMNDLLDEKDFIPDSYVFEVSSPGLGRPLKKEKDFARNMGKQVEIKTYRAIDRCKDFCGTLTAYDENSVTIADDDEKTTTFMRTDIALIRQAIDF
jgi:ribosome maturation factor RimP